MIGIDGTCLCISVVLTFDPNRALVLIYDGTCAPWTRDEFVRCKRFERLASLGWLSIADEANDGKA